MSVEITRSVEFDAGHRVASHDGKCRHPHGHRYRVEITIGGPVPASGMIVDFGALARLLQRHVHDRLDHGFMLDRHDDELVAFQEAHGFKTILFDGPPTAEELACSIHDLLAPLCADLGAALVRTRVYETPKCWADCNG